MCLSGYSYGCVLAHQMGYQLQQDSQLSGLSEGFHFLIWHIYDTVFFLLSSWKRMEEVETACSSTLLTRAFTERCAYLLNIWYVSCHLNGLKSALWLVMVYFGTWMHTVDCECDMILHESRTAYFDNSVWMLGTLSFALLMLQLDQLQMVMSQAGVNAAVVMFDLEAMGTSCRVMIRWLCWFATVCQSVRVMSNLFMIQVTWPPPQTNERVGGYEFLGGEAEAKQIDKINDFWYLLLITSIFYLLFARSWKYICYKYFK